MTYARVRLIGLALLCLLVVGTPASTQTATQTAAIRRLYLVLVQAGIPITGVSPLDGGGYRVSPPSLQATAQPLIDAFNPDDPAHVLAEADADAKRAVDAERLSSAIVWTILKQMYPADTDAQTKTKYGIARTRIIDAYKAQPWK